MAIKPILFNTEMVQAILDGRKTCTRRIMKPQLTAHYGTQYVKPPYGPGDILYVRETWHKSLSRYMYRADYFDTEKFFRNGKEVKIKWHPSIHMPKEAARIWLRVTDVRVERLQKITIDDIRREGLSSVAVHAGDMEIALEEWKMLWNSTIKNPDIDRYGWDASPWVWVIEFERCEKPEEKSQFAWNDAIHTLTEGV